MFNEDMLEQAIISKFRDLDYEYTAGDNLHRKYTEVLIEDDLRTHLKSKYVDEEITDSEIDGLIRDFKFRSPVPVYEANKAIFQKLADGTIIKREEPEKKDFHLEFIDYANPENNIFRVVNQMTIEGIENQQRRPDLIVYINGFPVAVFEFKSTVREDATIHDAYSQLTTRYKRDIPELFKYNGLLVISDGVNTKTGSLFGDYEHFHSWRRIGLDDEPVENGPETLNALLYGLFSKDRLTDYLKNFVFFPDKQRELKITASYPQYFAARKLHRNIKKHMKPFGDGRGGTYFGTTGCGKSYIMLFLSRLLMLDPELKSPTIVLITDRSDLDDQLSRTFTDARHFLGDDNITAVQSREELREKLGTVASGGVFLTTAQKFMEDFNNLSDRENIIVISDEAHRTQTNLEKKTRVAKGEVRSKYGFAKFIHDSFPNATYVGFTGTPVDKTLDVFGEIVDDYKMSDSVKDGITVRLVYDGRPARMSVDSEKADQIEKYYEDCLDQGADEEEVEESKKSVGIINVIGNRERLEDIADYFIRHFSNRLEESAGRSQALFVCTNRLIAYDFYNILKEKKPEWFEDRLPIFYGELSEDEKEKVKPLPMVKLIATRGANDSEEMYRLLGSDEDRTRAATDFKEFNNNFRVAIVCDMWTTGFDVPQLDVIYLDKGLSRSHAIIQTISRVNRSFEGKSEGLIVDFFGIKKGLMNALNTYSDFEREEIEDISKVIQITKNEMEVLGQILYPLDTSPFYHGTPVERFELLQAAAEKVMSTEDIENRFLNHVFNLSKAYRLCNAPEDFTAEENDEVHLYMAVRAYIRKLKTGKGPDAASMNEKVREMVDQAIQSDGIEELYTTDAEFNIVDLDLFSPEIMEKIMKIKQPNTKVKAMTMLLKRLVRETKRLNKVKGVEFEKRLKKIVDDYNSRAITDVEVLNQVIDETVKSLLKAYEEIKKDRKSYRELGIDQEEKAFYDILVAVSKKYDFDFPKEGNIKLAKEIRKIVAEGTSYSDWMNQRSVKARMNVQIRIALRNAGYPPTPKELYTMIYDDIIEQAENFKKYTSA